MTEIRLGTLSVGTKIDLTGLNSGITAFQVGLARLTGKIPAIGGALQSATSAGLRGFNALAGGMSSVFSSVGRFLTGIGGQLLAFFGAAGLGALLTKSVQAFGEQEQAVASLEQALRNMGQEIDANSEALQKQAAALQSVTTFGDEAIVGAQSLLVTLGRLRADAIEPVVRASLDFATAMKIDLDAAARTVAKTIGTDTNALARYGIEVEGAAGSTERLNSVLEGLARFQGAAEAKAATMTGRIEQMKNAFGEILESVGEFSLKLVDMNGQSATASERFLSIAKAISEATKTEDFGKLVTVVRQFFGAVKEAAIQIVKTASTLSGFREGSSKTTATLWLAQKAVLGVTAAMQFITLIAASARLAFEVMVLVIRAKALTLAKVLNTLFVFVAENVNKIAQAILPIASVVDSDLATAIANAVGKINRVIQVSARGIREFSAVSAESIQRVVSAQGEAARAGVAFATTLEQLTGISDVAASSVEGFARKTSRSGTAAHEAAEEIGVQSAQTEESGKNASLAADENERFSRAMENLVTAARRSGDAIAATNRIIDDMARSSTRRIRDLELETASIEASTEIERLQVEQTQAREQAERRASDSLREISDQERESRGRISEAIEEHRKALSDLHIEQGSIAEFEQEFEAGPEIARRKAEVERLTREGQDAAGRFSESRKQALIESTREAEGIQRQFAVRIRRAEEDAAEDARRNAEDAAEDARKARENESEKRQKEIEDESKARLDFVRSAIDTEILVIQDGQVRIGDVLKGSQEKFLALIVKSVNDQVLAFLSGQNQMVSGAAGTGNALVGIFSRAGGVIQGILSSMGIGGGGGLISEAGGLTAKIAGGVRKSTTPTGAGGIAGLINPASALLIAGGIAKSFFESKKGRGGTGGGFASVASSAATAFAEGASDTARGAVGIARETGATTIVQQIMFPVTIRVETGENDLVAATVTEAVRSKVVPMLKREIADGERNALLQAAGTPRRLARG